MGSLSSVVPVFVCPVGIVAVLLLYTYQKARPEFRPSTTSSRFLLIRPLGLNLS